MKTIIISSNTMGDGSEELGAKLIASFLRKVWGMEQKPARILLYNSGVKLLAEGSGVLDALDSLYSAGVDLIACGTCVTYFDLKDKIAIGRVSDMNEIASSMMDSDKVITI